MTHVEAHAHEDHHPFMQHHWETPAQQFEAGKLGMWLFLATEILLFGGLFCGYAVYRAKHPEVFIYAHQFLDKTLGGVNTLVLICSSLTMAWAVRAAQLGNRRLLVNLLGVEEGERLWSDRGGFPQLARLVGTGLVEGLEEGVTQTPRLLGVETAPVALGRERVRFVYRGRAPHDLSRLHRNLPVEVGTGRETTNLAVELPARRQHGVP